MRIPCLVLVAVLALVSGERVRFDNYRVYDVAIENVDQLQVMQYLEQYPDGVRTFALIFITTCCYVICNFSTPFGNLQYKLV